MTQNITYKVANGVGWLMLNRPEKLNALSPTMIENLFTILKDWKADDNIKLVVLQGAGEKAFCSGGDVRQLYDHKDDGVHALAKSFFATEYKMNMIMHTLGKPLVVYMNGIVMGGGVGLSVAGSHRIVTETTRWAMPEMNIGLYPDVGGSYFLNKMPNHIGRYLALTSNMINAADVLTAGAADYYLSSSNWSALAGAIWSRDWNTVDVVKTLEMEIEKFVELCPQVSKVKSLSKDITWHFGYETLEEIVASLEKASKGQDEWADKTLTTILSKSPTSLKVTLEQLVRGKSLPLKECFIMELEMSMNFMSSHDFFEGVRSVLVDKDRNPIWQPNTIGAVSKEAVESFFKYDWESINPLMDFEL